MCGFTGYVALEGKRVEQPQQVLTAMSSLLQHRGPDQDGLRVFESCGLAHRRLSVIDLSPAGRQPMANEDQTVWLAYNGEIYNFRELKRNHALAERGHVFASRTDTEVLLHLYEEKGTEALPLLDGMYAFALWDARRRIALLARDPFGVKPLFYARIDGVLWFASEPKALLLAPGYNRRPSLEALFHYLSMGYVPDELSAFEGIRELRPGHLMQIDADSGQVHIERFFDLDYEADGRLDERDAIARSRELLRQAVHRQLVADVPVGVMLSGGMDSSALTAFVRDVRGDSDFHTFSIGFNEPSFDESPYSQQVADHLGTKHHHVCVTPDRVRDLLPKYLAYIDEPYADGSAIPTYLLAGLAKEHVVVLLSGEGGDEVFSGYDTHLAYKFRRWYRAIPAFVRRGVIAPLVSRLPVSHKKLSFEFKAKRFVAGAELDVPTSHFSWREILSQDAKRQILLEWDRFSDFAHSAQYFVEAYRQCAADDELNRLLYTDLSYHLPDDLMIKNDRMTMAHSLEARVPFTDVDLVRFLASVPVRLKLKGRRKKHLLREAMRPDLPREVLEKKKVGLEMPYSQWLLAELRDLAEDYFTPEHLERTGLISGRAVRRLWQEHCEGMADHGRPLWALLNYMMWHEMYIESRDFERYLTTPRPPRPAAPAPQAVNKARS